MRFSLFQKLAISILSLSILGTGLLWLSTRLLFEDSFVSYLNNQNRRVMERIADRLAEHYEVYGNWQNLNRVWRDISSEEGVRQPLAPPQRPSGGMQLGQPSGMQRPPAPRPDLTSPALPRYALVDMDRRHIAGSRSISSSESVLRVPVRSEGDTVGFLLGTRQGRITAAIDRNFAESLNRSILIAFGTVLLFSLAFASLLARNMAKPIRTLSTATHDLNRGDYSTRITTDRSDEIGQLMKDVNVLAKTLEANKHSQQRWIADISHELRTPLAVLKAELHAIEDGVRSFDEGTLKSLLSETERFTRLVNDLYDLSRAESGDLDYQLEPLDLNQSIEEAIEQFAGSFESKDLKISKHLSPEPLIIGADHIRITQLLSNLLGNSHRYTDAGGQLSISSCARGNHAELQIEDSAPGVPANALTKIFDRLYRVETSRSREHGGGGLGLALCKAIVEAHHGVIAASESELGGLKVTVTLPLERS